MTDQKNKDFKELTDNWIRYLFDLSEELRQVREMIPGFYALGEINRDVIGTQEMQVHGIELLALTLGYFITVNKDWSEQYEEHSFIYETKDGRKVRIFELKPREKSEDAEENKEGGEEA